jgi:hypothetical protein
MTHPRVLAIPMAKPVKTILNVVVVVVLVLWLLQLFGIIDSVRGIRVG